MMQEYEQLIRLIETTNLVAVFEMLDKCKDSFTNETLFHALQKEYINKPNNYSEVDFCARLHVFAKDEKENICQAFETPLPALPAVPIPKELTAQDLAHCLRPTFTQTLWHHVFTRPKSLNLTGEAGKGKTRQLEDLKAIATHYQIPTALVNIHDFRKDYPLFLSKIATQLGLKTTIFVAFSDLLTVLHQTFKDRVCLVMIDEIEVLNDYEGNDSRYDHTFISGINHLKNSQEVRLLCASREWLKAVHFNGKTSFPALTNQDLPTLLYDTDIEAEIGRQAPAITLPTHRELIRNKVRKEPDNYRLLDFLLRKAIAHYTPENFNQNLDEWYEAYRQNQKRPRSFLSRLLCLFYNPKK